LERFLSNTLYICDIVLFVIRLRLFLPSIFASALLAFHAFLPDVLPLTDLK